MKKEKFDISHSIDRRYDTRASKHKKKYPDLDRLPKKKKKHYKKNLEPGDAVQHRDQALRGRADHSFDRLGVPQQQDRRSCVWKQNGARFLDHEQAPPPGPDAGRGPVVPGPLGLQLHVAV